jgi:hypothetical protein
VQDRNTQLADNDKEIVKRMVANGQIIGDCFNDMARVDITAMARASVYTTPEFKKFGVIYDLDRMANGNGLNVSSFGLLKLTSSTMTVPVRQQVIDSGRVRVQTSKDVSGINSAWQQARRIGGTMDTAADDREAFAAWIEWFFEQEFDTAEFEMSDELREKCTAIVASLNRRIDGASKIAPKASNGRRKSS